MTEDETVGWYHRLNGHELEQTPGDGEGQGSLACFATHGVAKSQTLLSDSTVSTSRPGAELKTWYHMADEHKRRAGSKREKTCS